MVVSGTDHALRSLGLSALRAQPWLPQFPQESVLGRGDVTQSGHSCGAYYVPETTEVL